MQAARRTPDIKRFAAGRLHFFCPAFLPRAHAAFTFMQPTKNSRATPDGLPCCFILQYLFLYLALCLWLGFRRSVLA